MLQSVETPIFIGGAGSSGSSLLAAIMNRHPEVYCGAETSFFNKSRIYEDFGQLKKKLPLWLEKGLPTDGYFLYPRILPHANHDILKPAILCRCANESTSTINFINSIQSFCLNHSGKRLFAEKTPSNAYCFGHMLSLYADCTLIHPVRDGRDVVCSLKKRGFDIFSATSMWLYNTACAIMFRDCSNYIEYKYEDLVRDPNLVLSQICDKVGVAYDPMMLIPHTNEVRSELESVWANSPNDTIRNRSIGRHKRELSADDYTAFCSVALTDVAAQKLGSQPYTAFELLLHLGYTATPPEKHLQRGRAVLLEKRDALRRSLFLMKRGWPPRRSLTELRVGSFLGSCDD